MFYNFSHASRMSTQEIQFDTETMIDTWPIKATNILGIVKLFQS